MTCSSYVSFFKEYFNKVDAPRVLEIGAGVGATTLPLLCHLSRTKKQFVYIAVDVRLEKNLAVFIDTLDLTEHQLTRFVQKNSLIFFDDVPPGTQFDVVILDGDKNYHTVSTELKKLTDGNHLSNRSVILVSSGLGPDSEKDSWCWNRCKDESKRALMTQPLKTNLHGNKAAIDSFLLANPGWTVASPTNGSAVLLFQKSMIMNNKTHEAQQAKISSFVAKKDIFK